MAARLDLEAPDDPQEVSERLAAAQELFKQTKKTKLRESKVPFLSPTIRNEEILKINPGYRVLQRRLKPTHIRNRELRYAYRLGFEQGAAELGLEGLKLAHGKEILRRTPRKIRVLPIDQTDTEVRALSEFGIQLRWSKPEAPQDPAETAEEGIRNLEAYRPDIPLAISAASVWERTRAKRAEPPQAGETRSLYEHVLEDLREQIDATSAF